MSNAQADNEELAAPPRAASVYSGAPFTLFLTVLNVLVFAGEVAMTWSADGFAGPELANALFAIPGQVAMAFGSNYGTATLYEGRIDTLVASCFVHFGVLHLAFNLYALRQIGPFLEHEVGTGRTSVLYLGSGIVGSMVSAIYRGWFLDRGISAGASGAVCGLIGATLVVGFRTQGWRSPLMRAMGLWLVVTLIIGLSGGIDNAAHGGGAVAGGLIALLWKRGGELPVLRTLSVVATVGTILAAGLPSSITTQPALL